MKYMHVFSQKTHSVVKQCSVIFYVGFLTYKLNGIIEIVLQVPYLSIFNCTLWLPTIHDPRDFYCFQSISSHLED